MKSTSTAASALLPAINVRIFRSVVKFVVIMSQLGSALLLIICLNISYFLMVLVTELFRSDVTLFVYDPNFRAQIWCLDYSPGYVLIDYLVCLSFFLVIDSSFFVPCFYFHSISPFPSGHSKISFSFLFCFKKRSLYFKCQINQRKFLSTSSYSTKEEKCT